MRLLSSATIWTSGDKSLGAYQLGTGGSITVNRAAAISAYSTAYVLPTEDEWYKAAYYDPAMPGGPGYWEYPTCSDMPPWTNLKQCAFPVCLEGYLEAVELLSYWA